MGTVRNVAVAVLILSFFTFVAFFGRLPALRNTPIGSLHRVIWVHIPRAFRAADKKLTNGRLSASVGKLAHTLWNDRHPVVMRVLLSDVLLLCTERKAASAPSI
ncbi:hypothetical protein EYC80_009362 [Monilinia laxa]|uniref:Uncharacterized protein n=1 Tax=Monilinia laxa TaxID=61186 RepID=A0A5N6JXQ2_MONLA|nr:hypothetical protein EYC80_009362 [Monilinia laxa]